MSALTNWQLEQLIGRVDEQRRLEHIFQQDIAERRGRTIVITGPLGSGQAALARFALWDSSYSLPLSFELNAISGHITPPTQKTTPQQIARTALSWFEKISQGAPWPYNALLVLLASIGAIALLKEKQQQLFSKPPSPRSLKSLIEDAAGAVPFALHITELDDPELDERWIDAIVDVAKYTHDLYPVLLLLSTVTSRPLAELEEWQMTLVQRRLRKLLDEQLVEAWHLGSVSVDDMQRYVTPADGLVIRRLHELSGGWPLMVQALWRSWRNSTQKDSGGGSRKPVLAGDGLVEPWRFTPYGLSATAHVEQLLDDLLDAYPAALEMLAVLLDEDEDPRDTLRYILSVATLEGKSFTGMAVAGACGLPWEDGLEEVFDALVDAGLLIDDSNGYDEVPTAEGPQPLYRYRFALPIWWHLFHEDPNFTDEERREAARKLAQALEECYGSLAWRKLAEITALWEQAGDLQRVRFQRRVLDQLAYIGRLRIRAELAEQSAQRTGAWLDAHRAWLELAGEMRGYVKDVQIFTIFEYARLAAERSGSAIALAETYGFIATWANVVGDRTKAEETANEGLNVLGDWRDAEAQRQRGRLLHEIGRVYHERQELDTALDYYEQARVLMAAHGTPAQLGVTLHQIGRVHHDRNELDAALRYYEQAWALEEAHGTPANRATTLHEIGRVHHARNQLDAALVYLQQALAIWEQGSDQKALAGTLYRLAAVYLDHGKCQLALDHVRRALDIRRVNNLDVADEEALERRILAECKLSSEE